MKNSKKIIAALSGVSLASASVVPFLSSCSEKKTYDVMVTPLKEETIKQFKNLTEYVPHYSNESGSVGSLTKIKKYYYDLVNNMGLKCVQQDNGTNYEGNLYFDIDATAGHENDPMIILQGHIDMVEAHDKDRYPEFDPTKDTIKLVEDTVDGRPVIHSENYLTSIGADDGIGVATILAIAAKRDEFTHGKIRCLLTTDEETSMGGVVNLPKNWFREDPNNESSNLINYLLNIDCENINTTDVANGGGFEYLVKIQNLADYCSEPKKSDHIYKITASSFKGDHSASFTKTQMSALRAVTSIVGEYMLGGTDETYVNHVKLNQIVSTYPSNAIPKDSTITFAVATDVKEDLQKLVDNKLQDIKQNYTDEVNAKITLEEISTQPKNVLDENVSYGLIATLNDWICGSIVPKTEIKEYTSANITPVSLDLTSEPNFIARTLIRSFDIDILWMAYKSAIYTVEQYLYPQMTNPETEVYAVLDNYYEPWLPPDNNPLREILIDGYHSANINPEQVYTPGGLECSWLYAKQPNLNIGVTGPTVINAHTEQETVYLDTLDPLMQIVLYTIRHLK